MLPDNVKQSTRLTAILWVLTLLGCQSEPPATPMCRAVVGATPYLSSPSVNKAACLTRINNAVLMVRQRSSGLLALPIGVKASQESLRCAAHRAMWEQTGFNVEVGQFLTQTDTGIPVFDCRGEDSLVDLPSSFDAPPWAQEKATDIVSINPFTMSKEQLHDRDTLIPLRDAFVVAQTASQ